MKLSVLFQMCIEGSYVHTENSGDYFTYRDGENLYIFFQSSKGAEDWKNNLDFPVRPYKGMGDLPWLCHRGYLRVWKSLEEYLKSEISDRGVSRVVCTGYSHGGALCALCHEYVWYNRPDLRESLEGYGFGAPRIFFGVSSAELKKRWERFTVIRNIDDLVTHLPPAIFGYSHVGKMLEIGEGGKYSRIDAHREENILAELRRAGL